MQYLSEKAHEYFHKRKFSKAKKIYLELKNRFETNVFDYSIELCNKYIDENKDFNTNNICSIKEIINDSNQEDIVNGIKYINDRINTYNFNKINISEKVSVIVPTFNNGKYIKQCIESLLNQTYSNIEIIVVDDCSTDDTAKIINLIDDKRLVYYKLNQNLGAYFARSYGILKSTGDYLTFQDSDDFSNEKRIEIQLSAMLEHKLLLSTSNYIRIDEKMNIIKLHGKYEKYGLITLMFYRSIIEKTGFYDITTRGGDAEFELRIRKLVDKKQTMHLALPTYIARSVEGSLTSNEINLSENNINNALSSERRMYIESVKNLLPSFKNSNLYEIFEFPMLRSPYHLEGVLSTSSIPEKVIGCACLIPERLKIFEDVLKTIICQVDILYIFLDKMDTIPNFLVHEKVKCQFSSKYGNIAAGGKFMPLIDKELSKDIDDDSIYFTFDDDILYPVDYVHSMYKKLKKYHFTSVCGLHGSILHENFEQYKRDRKILHFLKKLEKDTFVDILGTGTTCFKVKLIRNKMSKDYLTPRMIDIGFSKVAKNYRIPFIAVSREAQWLKDVSGETPSLFDELKADDSQHTSKLKEKHNVGYGEKSIYNNYVSNHLVYQENKTTKNFSNIKLDTNYLRFSFYVEDVILKIVIDELLLKESVVQVLNSISTNVIYNKTFDNTGKVSFLINTTANPNINIIFDKNVTELTHLSISYIQEVSSPRKLYENNNAITACLATYPPRKETFKDVYYAISSKVDNFCVYLNRYDKPLEYLSENTSIHYILDQDGHPKASGKFRWLKTKGYIFILDDDIIYPKDYFQHLIHFIEKTNRTAFVGVHGMSFEKNIQVNKDHIVKSYIKEKHNFGLAVEKMQKVHLLGTGTLAFHSSLIEKYVDELYLLLNFDAKTANANDEALALFANKHKIPMFVVPRKQGWLQSNKKMKYGIHEEHFNDNSFSNDVAQMLSRGNPWN